MNSIIAGKRTLITGGAGFIGSNLVRKLLKLGYDVDIIVKKTTNLWRLKNVLSQIKIHKVDILDEKKLAKTIRSIKPKIIIHLATYSHYRNSKDYDRMIKINIQGTLNLLSLTKNLNYEIFINTGSSSEYGIKDKPMKETDLLEPISPYAATKASATLLCQLFAREFKKPIVTLRPFSVYGPYEENDRLIPTIIKSVIKKKPIKITPGYQRRDFIYTDDVTDVYLKTIKKGKKLSGQVFNLGTGKEYTNDEVVKTLFRIAKEKVPIKKGAFPKRVWDTKHWVADISKTKRLLNWKPRFTLEEGLRDTYLWFRKSNLL